MTETLEQEPVTAPVPPPPHKPRPNRVYQAAAWVAIVAGVVFIVSAIFFTGFALGRNSGDGRGGIDWGGRRGGGSVGGGGNCDGRGICLLGTTNRGGSRGGN